MTQSNDTVQPTSTGTLAWVGPFAVFALWLAVDKALPIANPAKDMLRDGVLLAYIRHTSASLVIQENADPDVQTDLVTALQHVAPANAGWVHDTEGPDDMPAHIKAMVNGVSLHVPVAGGKLALGTWQGIYVAEHRARPHQREVLLSFIGSKR